ncbi:MAG TPA: YicC/YloC family endoribonuclease [Thermoanaerobaculia bacterium]|nr:YicC/YloC family endoribonuclease [Thermoanaerobaculia bacterium]
MTGFGRADRTGPELSVAVEIRSVNHRYLDLQIRLPEPWRCTEPAIRSLLGERLARGRIDLAVEVRDGRAGAVRAHLDERLVQDLVDRAAEIAGGGGQAPIGLRDLIALPGVVRLESSRGGGSDAEAEAMILELSGQALAELERARELEGGILRASLGGALSRLDEKLTRVRELREPARGELLDRHRRRILELLGGVDVELDEARLAQEAAILAERSDFEEELERLGGHLERFRDALDAEGAVGKRLDFLAQEIHRELNTLGVKCRDGRIAALVIEAKLECDRLREQLLNVE